MLEAEHIIILTLEEAANIVKAIPYGPDTLKDYQVRGLLHDVLALRAVVKRKTKEAI